MKNLIALSFIILFSFAVQAQEQKIEIVVPTDSVETEVSNALMGKLSCSVNGEEIVHLDDYPFKVYTFLSKNENWNTQQDVYNTIQTKVPSVRIRNTYLNTTPRISMRGDDNTIVIVDGVRVDASILNTLNPADIESIRVSNNPIARNSLQYQ